MRFKLPDRFHAHLNQTKTYLFLVSLLRFFVKNMSNDINEEFHVTVALTLGGAYKLLEASLNTLSILMVKNYSGNGNENNT